MVQKFAAAAGLVILITVIPAESPAQDAKTFLGTVAKAMGAENLTTIQYSGMGSTAAPGQPLTRLKSYKREIDLNGTASRTQMVVVQNGVDQSQTQTIVPKSPWESQYDFWLTPYGFLKGAMLHETMMKPETVFGEKFNVLSFMIQDKYRVNGYVNEKNTVEKIETRLDNDVLVQGVYLEYKDFGGLKFSTTVLQKRNGANTLILIVDDVKPNAAVNIPLTGE
jgi:hypothetical protein